MSDHHSAFDVGEHRREIILFEELIEEYLSILRNERHLSPHTSAAYRADLNKLIAFAAKWQITEIGEMDEPLLEDFILDLKTSGASENTVRRMIASLHGFFDYLAKRGILPRDTSEPLCNIESAKGARKGKVPEPLPPEELSDLLAAPGREKRAGIRDTAILYLLASSGMKVTELLPLRIRDLDFLLNTVRVQAGTENERSVPLDDAAADALRVYIDAFRHDFTGRDDILFRNRTGGSLTRQRIWKLVRDYGVRAGIREPVTPERLRDTAAARLLSFGMEEERVRELLGLHSLIALRQYTEQRI
ncbi:integrase/recombinase XerD [Lachnospiraceae bacterium NK3A20]|nr:integrase/recombinase XerD [Lachnospiraceae bacterium NK3A20]